MRFKNDNSSESRELNNPNAALISSQEYLEFANRAFVASPVAYSSKVNGFSNNDKVSA